MSLLSCHSDSNNCLHNIAIHIQFTVPFTIKTHSFENNKITLGYIKHCMTPTKHKSLIDNIPIQSIRV